MRRGRKVRKFEIERIMSRQAWSALELSQILHISPLNTRRYLRRYMTSNRLIRKRFGTTWYYVVEIFTKPAAFSYRCPRCSARMDVYIKRCGCEFQVCGQNIFHSLWKYCKFHKGTIPRFQKIEAQCAICKTKEVVRVDRKENKITGEWKYYGRICPPGESEKIDYWECPKCIKSAELIEE